MPCWWAMLSSDLASWPRELLCQEDVQGYRWKISNRNYARHMREVLLQPATEGRPVHLLAACFRFVCSPHVIVSQDVFMHNNSQHVNVSLESRIVLPIKPKTIAAS